LVLRRINGHNDIIKAKRTFWLFNNSIKLAGGAFGNESGSLVNVCGSDSLEINRLVKGVEQWVVFRLLKLGSMSASLLLGLLAAYKGQGYE